MLADGKTCSPLARTNLFASGTWNPGVKSAAAACGGSHRRRRFTRWPLAGHDYREVWLGPTRSALGSGHTKDRHQSHYHYRRLHNLWLRPGSISFSPDSKWLAFVAHFGGVRLWDVNARSEVTNLPAFNEARTPIGLAFSLDSRTLAYNEDEHGAILLWDLASRSLDRLAGHHDLVTALAFSPDGQTLASGSQDRTAKLWNLADRRVRLELTNHTRGLGSLAFSPMAGRWP
jgi:WD40 repeat protein